LTFPGPFFTLRADAGHAPICGTSGPKYGIPLFLWEKYRTGKNRHLLTHALLTFLEAPGPAW
jgi:hypothetical protein